MSQAGTAQGISYPAPHRPGVLDGIGLEFTETMSGYVAVGASEPAVGAQAGRSQNTPLRFDVHIRIADLAQFFRDPQHLARLDGTVTFAPLGGTFPISEGSFNLFCIDPATGMRQMTYDFRFMTADGNGYQLHGHKDIYDDPGVLDAVTDMTRLFTTIRRGDGGGAPIYAAGELYFNLLESPALMASMKVQNAKSWSQKVAAYAAFSSFAYGALRDEYLKDVRLFYDTRYENLVVAGELETGDSTSVPFFFVSGIHDKGFPWGDTELFWDVVLAIADGHGGYQRYCITDRIMEGLHLDLTTGSYQYRGPIYQIQEGFSASFTQLHKRDAADTRLVPCDAEIDIEFAAHALDAVPFPFPLVPKLVRKMSSGLGKELREHLPGENPLGINITPHTLAIRSGRIRLQKNGEPHEWRMVGEKSTGEGERGTFRNLKEPTFLYGYVCALDRENRRARVQILSRTLRNERTDWVNDRVDGFLGSVISRMSSAEMLVEDVKLGVRPLPPAGIEGKRAVPFRKLGPPILEVNNDHFPTGVFQRRIIEVLDPGGKQCLALEEDMSLMRLEAVNSSRKAKVASIEHDDKFAALDQVLEQTDFYSLLETKLVESGKDRPLFSIAVKPNFMFAYDKRDHTTYTDPQLVGHLVTRIRERGFQAIHVVEAQSTYGEFFDQRSVRAVAAYLGYDGSAGYDVIDMTEDATESSDLGPHLGVHPVSRVWRDADFRVSFAKNKTHAYSYYTLTLKNIYGALPLANKFREYHCKRGIYETAIDYLAAFPVHYGLVDAYLSADGPFGIFADTVPNDTRTIIGGADLVAVDWVAASKMGIDPMISKYMELAVNRFGKPEIALAGSANPYRPWLNVPVALTLFTSKGLDADYHFGNLFYTAASQMDETHFHRKHDSWFIRGLRRLTVPLRRTFFLRTGENPSLTNRVVSRLLYRMGF